MLMELNPMVTLTETENHLILTPDAECADDLADVRDLTEALEDYLCNGWEWIQAEECGALTGGEILSREGGRDDDGKLVLLGVVYWDSDYQVSDTLERLKAGESVRWRKIAMKIRKT